MDGNFDSLLTPSQMRRFDEALRDLPGNAQNSATQKQDGRAAPISEAQRPSEYEQRTWLVQQQDSSVIMRHVLAFRLSGTLDIGRLVVAVQTLVRASPNLNSRYRFSAEGDLFKVVESDAGCCLETVRVGSHDEAIQAVLARQAAPWDAELEPPFKALIVIGERETVLALLVHRILDESCPIEEILRNLGSAFDGKPLAPFTSRPDILAVRESSRMEWLRRRGAAGGVEVLGHPAYALADRWAEQSVWRARARVNSQALADLAGDPPMAAHILAVVSAYFAQFLCSIGEHESISLLVQRRPGTIVGDPAFPLGTSETLDLKLERTMPEADTIRLILSELTKEISGPAPGAVTPQDLPRTTITWLTDPVRFFESEGFVSEWLPIPTLERFADLALAVRLDSEQNVELQLLTGQAVSPYAGAYLLERFVAFITTRVSITESRGLFAESTLMAKANAPSAQATANRREPGTVAPVDIILSEFREALNCPTIGPDDDFFDQGGHSLVATRIIGRLLKNHGIELHLADLFSHPTASALAEHAKHVETVVDACTSGIDMETSLTAPLSLAQMSLWKAYAAFEFSDIFNIPFALDFLDPVDEHVFQSAFADVLERHSGLRTLFFADGKDVRQQVVPIHEVSRYKWFWTSCESAGVDRHFEARYRFDLANELPVRVRFLEHPDTGRQILSLLFHHIVLDEWSVNLLMDELVVAFRARAAGRAPVWSVRPAPFLEFARRQCVRGVQRNHLAYWTDLLRDAPRSLPIFGSEEERPEAQPTGSAAGSWIELKLSPENCAGLYQTAKENASSLFDVVYAAIAASMQKRGTFTDLVVGTSASGRTDAEFFDTIGYFTTVVAHRVRFEESMTVGDLVTAVKNTINESMVHGEIPIDLVEEALGMTPGREHLFEVFIQIHAKNKLNGALTTPGGRSIEFRQVDPDKHESLLGLQFEVMEESIRGERAIRVLMSYRCDRYGPKQVELIRTTTIGMLAQFACRGVSASPLASLWSSELAPRS